jgi:hypothetical protein
MMCLSTPQEGGSLTHTFGLTFGMAFLCSIDAAEGPMQSLYCLCTPTVCTACTHLQYVLLLELLGRPGSSTEELCGPWQSAEEKNPFSMTMNAESQCAPCHAAVDDDA